MHFMLVISAIVAAILVMAIPAPPPTAPNLAIEMAPNAADVLTSHGIWAPDPNAFAAGTPNVARVDGTVQSELLVQSGIQIKDLVYFTIGTATSRDVHQPNPNIPAVSDKVDCSHCDLCLKACIPMLLLYPFCAAGCFSQSYCNGCAPTIGG